MIYRSRKKKEIAPFGGGNCIGECYSEICGKRFRRKDSEPNSGFHSEAANAVAR